MRIEVVRKVCYSADLDDIYDQFDWDSIRECYDVKPWEGLTRNQVHDALCDDPAPYRRDIKGIQANMYEYLALYASDEIEIYVPGRRSQILKIIKDSHRSL